MKVGSAQSPAPRHDSAVDLHGPVPWVSILIPVYNVAPYLRDCINSLAGQISGNIEVILLDDASTDGSLHICEKICAERGAAFRLIRHDANRGLSAARNTLLNHARGNYIWFVDSDDEIMPGAMASLAAILHRCAPDLILCDFSKLGRNVCSFIGSANVLSFDREALLRGIFASRRMHSWSKIAQRRLWGSDLRFPIGRCFEDMATTPLLALRASSFYYAPEAWVRYRIRADSITGLVTRTRAHFDVARNDDVATALIGFIDAARQALPGLSHETCYQIEHFLAKEFTKICWRLAKARFGRDSWKSIVVQARRYRTMMEGVAPVPFVDLAYAYLMRGEIGRWLVLKTCLLVTV